MASVAELLFGLLSQVMKVVCVCWNTLDTRVREFTKTPTAALTYKGFEVAARMADREQQLMLEGMVSIGM